MSHNSLTTLKIIIFGSSSVGKTSLLTQLVDNRLFDTSATISPDLFRKKHNYDGNVVELALWDTAGQERFHSLPSNLYRDAQGAVLVYDVTDYRSFRELHSWMSNLEDYYDGSDRHPVVIVLGNKIDLHDKREVTRKQGLDFAKRHRALFLETSAKTRSGVDTAFDDLVTKIMETPGLWRSHNDSESVVSLNQNTSGDNWFKNCGQC